MSATEDFAPLTIDYTSRDFESLRLDLIERVKSRVPEWRGENPADFGLAMIEAFAHLGDIVSYYIDRVANENSIFTAVQRQSLINIAKSYGYVPSGYRPSNLTLRVAARPGVLDELVIPERTVFSYRLVENDVTDYLYFTATGTGVINQAGSPVNYVDLTVINAISIGIEYPADPEDANDVAGETLALGSSGAPNQAFTLSKPDVILDSIAVFVRNGEKYGRWTQVKELSDSGPSDPVFEVRLVENDRVQVVFGDNVGGAIPTIYETIKVEYLYGGGVRGNLPVTSPFSQLTVHYIPGLDVDEVAAISGSITASAITSGVGGSDPDSNELIRRLAPAILLTSDRAVSLADYAGLALRAPNVFRTAAQAENRNSINLFVAPIRTSTTTDPFPLFDEENEELTVEWESLQSEVSAALADKTQIGTSITFLPPQYTPINVELRFTLEEGFSSEPVIEAIKRNLTRQLGYTRMDFGLRVYPEQVEGLVLEIPGVVSTSVTKLYREGASEGRTSLVGGVGEFFIFRESTIEVVQNSNQTAVSGFAFDEVYGLYPPFDPEFLDYSLTIYAEDDELEIEIIGLPATATATISGELYTGAPVPVGTTEDVTEIPVVITAQDGITVRVYTITAIKEV